MTIDMSLDDLLDYTDWEREKWYDWFRRHGDQVLKISAGPHGDGRFESAGDVVKHIFSAEKRYVDRLSGRVLTDTASVPNDDVDALFQFSRRSRGDLRKLFETYADDWNAPSEYKIVNSVLRATPKKIVVHVLIHEIRHWAQIATLFRLNGLAAEFHDFLFSPVWGGEPRREQLKS
jgi:uncharacterized damage-inducible protein DinB